MALEGSLLRGGLLLNGSVDPSSLFRKRSGLQLVRPTQGVETEVTAIAKLKLGADAAHPWTTAYPLILGRIWPGIGQEGTTRAAGMPLTCCQAIYAHIGPLTKILIILLKSSCVPQ